MQFFACTRIQSQPSRWYFFGAPECGSDVTVYESHFTRLLPCTVKVNFFLMHCERGIIYCDCLIDGYVLYYYRWRWTTLMLAIELRVNRITKRYVCATIGTDADCDAGYVRIL